MPEIVERGHIYIAQPPLYKVKLGKDEQYLKDGVELDAYLLRVAMKDAQLDTGVPGALPLRGEALETLARQYVLANNVVERLSKWMDVEALRAMAGGLELDLDTLQAAEASALALKAALHDADVEAAFDARSDKHVLRIGRRHHGNTKTSVISADFVHGADYEALSTAGRTFKGLVGEGAVVRKGEGERQKEAKVGDFRAAFEFGLHAVERGNPRRQQVAVVAGSEETLGADEAAGVVFAPADATWRTARVCENVLHFGEIAEERLNDVVRTVQVRRAFRVGERESGFIGQRERLFRRVVGEIAAGCLIHQPFAHIAFVRAGFGSELGGGHCPRAGHGPVQAEFFADDHEGNAHRGGDVGQGLAHERMQPIVVDLERFAFKGCIGGRWSSDGTHGKTPLLSGSGGKR